MKIAYLAALPVALAAPANFDPRETREQITDHYLFSIPLPAFLQYRAQQSPETLDWYSDSCSNSPDNPFGFPFGPACERHDFGYRNYKAQNRFDKNSRFRIDNNFRDDMYYQCKSVLAQGSCRALANVYYKAVRMFGGYAKRDESSTEAPNAAAQELAEELISSYYSAIQEYRQAVKADQANGLLPQL